MRRGDIDIVDGVESVMVDGHEEVVAFMICLPHAFDFRPVMEADEQDHASVGLR